jgi:predicted phosphodiesterase
MGYVAEIGETSYEEDVEACNLFLDEIRRAAPGAEIIYLEGNHELRVERWCVTQSLRHQRDADFLRRLVGPEAVLRLADRGIQYVRMGERHNDLPVNGVIKRGQCLFTHGFSTAQAAATAHAKKAGMSIVYGHTHRHQSDLLRTIAGGVFGAWSPGCLAQLQSYYEHSNPNEHTHGYAIQIVDVDSGKFLHLNIPIVDGESMLPSISLKG